MKDKIVSVIIPCYNSENTIIECMESVHSQSYQDIEVIIIDDGSKDQSANIIRSYIKLHYLTNWVFISRENRGVSATRNEGILKSSGKFIALLDSDDKWLANKLDVQMKFLKQHNAKIVGCCFKRESKTEYQKYDLLDMLYHNRVKTSTVIIERSLIEAYHGFDDSMQYSEDYNLWLKIATKENIYIMSDALVEYDIHNQGGGLTRKLWLMEKGELSNFNYLRINRYITTFTYLKASSFSLFKYFIRRIRKVLHL